jgi:hypothetical protein
MLYGPLLAVLVHPSIVAFFSGPLEAGGLLGFFCAFCRLLGMLRTLFAHAASSVLLRWTFVALDAAKNASRAKRSGPTGPGAVASAAPG